MLTDDELTKIITRGESDRVEFTESCKNLDKIRIAICAFANDLPDNRKPGVVFIGIRDDKTCANLAIDDKLLISLGSLRSDGKILPFPSMDVAKKTLTDCEVAVIQVEPTDNPPVKVDGQCWIRTGPRRDRATAEDERRLTEKRRWGSMPYDLREVSRASVKNDLDMQRFEREYLPNAVSPEALAENDRDREQQLQALRLTTADGTPTVTAILVLGKDPGYWFPGAYIQFLRFAGNEATDPILDQKAIRGTMPDQLMQLDNILRANIAVALDTSGAQHIETPDYPYAALRELACNAVIHRDYENSNAPVRFYWYADKIEISSPGSVYGKVTRDNFGNPDITDYRNPTIAEAMKNMGFMERFGRGIRIARSALEKNGNPELKWDVQDTIVQMEIQKRP